MTTEKRASCRGITVAVQFSYDPLAVMDAPRQLSEIQVSFLAGPRAGEIDYAEPARHADHGWGVYVPPSWLGVPAEKLFLSIPDEAFRQWYEAEFLAARIRRAEAELARASHRVEMAAAGEDRTIAQNAAARAKQLLRDLRRGPAVGELGRSVPASRPGRCEGCGTPARVAGGLRRVEGYGWLCDSCAGECECE